jgi:hypothetical protein
MKVPVETVKVQIKDVRLPIEVLEVPREAIIVSKRPWKCARAMGKFQ